MVIVDCHQVSWLAAGPCFVFVVFKGAGGRITGEGWSSWITSEIGSGPLFLWRLFVISRVGYYTLCCVITGEMKVHRAYHR